MKVLAVSDIALPHMRNPDYLRRTYGDVDLLVSCGDMSVGYLDVIGSTLNLPLFFVRGNHDTGYQDMRLKAEYPDCNNHVPGGDNLHLRIQSYNRFTFAGLEGSINYNNGPVQYTQHEMWLNVLRLLPHLLLRRLFNGHGVDVMVTHSPPWGIHDIPDDYAHRGFKSFLMLMRWAQPRFLIHGHVDTWDQRMVTKTVFHNTQVININPVKTLVLDKPKP
ncbi:MAG: metallophosphoesterase [Anaerolineae bacterium]|nr:metallophosphoesterase [Anaerolineae bacterium]